MSPARLFALIAVGWIAAGITAGLIHAERAALVSGIAALLSLIVAMVLDGVSDDEAD